MLKNKALQANKEIKPQPKTADYRCGKITASKTKAFPPLPIRDPGLQWLELTSQTISETAPELFTILEYIKSTFLDFVTEEAVLSQRVEILPCLVGSQVSKFHPESLSGYPLSPADYDFEIFCFTKDPAEYHQFITQLSSRIPVVDFFASHPIIKNMMFISCHFNDYSDYLNIGVDVDVDVKFTIFTSLTLDMALYNSIEERVLCPKANLITFPWNIDKNASYAMFYYRNWLDFTLPPYHFGTLDFKSDWIAYGLFFHYLNPDYPMTSRFIDTITYFLKMADTDRELLQTTKIQFTKVYRNKFHLKTAQHTDILCQEAECDKIFTLISSYFKQKPLAVEVSPRPIGTGMHNFFISYKKIDSFCDAVFRQMVLLNYSRYKELGENPIGQLKHQMNVQQHPGEGSTDMSQIIRNFSALYPDINLIIYVQHPETFTLIRAPMNDHESDGLEQDSRIRISLVQHDNRYTPLLEASPLLHLEIVRPKEFNLEQSNGFTASVA